MFQNGWSHKVTNYLDSFTNRMQKTHLKPSHSTKNRRRCPLLYFICLECSSLILRRITPIFHLTILYSPKAFAMATLPKTAMIGTSTMELPRSEAIWLKVCVWLFNIVWKGGGFTSGKPSFTVPVNKNGDLPSFFS